MGQWTVFFLGDFLLLVSSASERELSNFVPISMDGSGTVRFDGSIDGSDAGLFVRSMSLKGLISSAGAESRVR